MVQQRVDQVAAPRGRAVAVLLIAALVIGLGALVRWRNGLHYFERGGATSITPSLAPGRTLYVGAIDSPSSDGRPRNVRFTNIWPAVTDNTAKADVQVLMCTIGPGMHAGLVAAYSTRDYCSSVTAFTPGTYLLGSHTEPGTVVILVAVTPHTAGHVHVAGLDLSYREGIRRGHQRAGLEADTTTPSG